MLGGSADLVLPIFQLNVRFLAEGISAFRESMSVNCSR